MEELEYIDCPLCGSNKSEVAIRSRDYVFSQKEFAVARCKACGVLFTNPRIKENQISHYHFAHLSSYKTGNRSVRFEKAKNRLRRLFGNTHYEIVEELRVRNAKTILEIGPGSGNLLFFLKEHGFEVQGIEMDEKCVERIRENGIKCYSGDLKNVITEIKHQKFDAVILCHVLEHLYRPKETLKNICGLLNEKGIIYLSLPNSGSLEAKLFGKYWRGLDLPRHIVHYDAKSIRSILSQTGFTILNFKSQIFPSSCIESMGIRFCKKKKMPDKLYYFLYYPWKLLAPVHNAVIGSGAMTIVAGKLKKED